ncbi:uncharacterized protein BT62DRAFT_935938 [Guyanagaster necrorhizus]|uniref:Secreted protein n=1 Tax=Guyanagaster necrorhizus TaxID=856835 RepID=A0A9P7VMJ1_9AGAR|nr:uncharacterized protein BT62DRAFT_935938 [Guyanagaster necrorhizus MCA 3950]KAG7442634.1 hypothetical protein BT62DRAFT_935938 [Guyanagaster necrorhizus MCA 3950]
MGMYATLAFLLGLRLNEGWRSYTETVSYTLPKRNNDGVSQVNDGKQRVPYSICNYRSPLLCTYYVMSGTSVTV